MLASIVASSELENASELLDAMRGELLSDLEGVPQHRDVVGDARMLRFLEGYSGSVKDAVNAFRSMLLWRKENDLETIRAQVAGKPLRAESLLHSEKILAVTLESGGNAPIMEGGRSYSGDLISIELVGMGNPSALLEATTETELKQNFISFFELRQILMDEVRACACACAFAFACALAHALRPYGSGACACAWHGTRPRLRRHACVPQACTPVGPGTHAPLHRRVPRRLCTVVCLSAYA